MSFNCKVHKELGGDQLTVESGGAIVVKSGGSLTVEAGGTFSPAGNYDLNAAELDNGEEVIVKSGGKVTVASGGILDMRTGSLIKANGTQHAHVVDASVAHALNATFSDTEVEGALDALGGKINLILAALEGAGINAAS